MARPVERWSQFERMIRRLGALRVELDQLGGEAAGSADLEKAFREAVGAVCEFGTAKGAVSAADAWAALDAVEELAGRAGAAVPAGSNR